MTYKTELEKALDYIEEAIPFLPPIDARCHIGIRNQEECCYCSRIIKANKAIKVLREIHNEQK